MENNINENIDERYLNTQEVADMMGISKSTLLQWFRLKKVRDVGRDEKGWRIFSDEDIKRLTAFKKSLHLMNRFSPSFIGMEKRQFKRISKKFPIVCKVVKSPSKKGTNSIQLKTNILNISGGGVMFENNNPLPVSSLISLNILIPKMTDNIKTLSEIRWCVKDNKTQNKYLIGCQFIETAKKDYLHLMESLFS